MRCLLDSPRSINPAASQTKGSPSHRVRISVRAESLRGGVGKDNPRVPEKASPLQVGCAASSVRSHQKIISELWSHSSRCVFLRWSLQSGIYWLCVPQVIASVRDLLSRTNQRPRLISPSVSSSPEAAAGKFNSGLIKSAFVFNLWQKQSSGELTAEPRLEILIVYDLCNDDLNALKPQLGLFFGDTWPRNWWLGYRTVCCSCVV